MQGLDYVTSYLGEADVPKDVRRRRKSVVDAMRRLGTPVIVKNRLTALDQDAGTAVPSANFESVYGQPRAGDPLSHGTGFVSIELSDDEWVIPNGSAIVTSDFSPGVGFTKAPKYRGYGPGFLTYVVMPDVAMDFFLLNSTGAITKAQDAKAITAFYPDLNDNDLLIAVSLDRDGNVTDTFERYEVKQKTPVTMRGLDRRGRRGDSSNTAGNRYVINQMFNMAALPAGHVAYNVETDR